MLAKIAGKISIALSRHVSAYSGRFLRLGREQAIRSVTNVSLNLNLFYGSTSQTNQLTGPCPAPDKPTYFLSTYPDSNTCLEEPTVRIPLDYYRILIVPIQATAEQLKQAYSDRLQQQPRREYGETAIVARQKLIENAYLVLSSVEQRTEYDARFFQHSPPTDLAQTASENSEPEPVRETPPQAATLLPSIEIAAEEFAGVLLVLQELGEYEQVLTLGADYLNSAEYAKLVKHQDAIAHTSLKQDIILSLALAYLELGREQWHRQEYENAALSDRLGIDLLTQENLFPGVKAEIEIDLYKLRPYRILELIARNPVESEARATGFQLLQEMLAQRQGIEGQGEDLSGLTFERFLCFIQQLRTHLTSSEQEQLFLGEARTASPIANYLAVYALVARGFALKQPQSILRAQQMLEFLSQQQDVYWEESLCALLLGHTQKAIKKLLKSGDMDNIEIIKHHSPNSDDMLPGLCFYGEKWLQEEVLSQFCDLVEIKITLKEYFADREVQKYLEELIPVETSESEEATEGAEVKIQNSSRSLKVPAKKSKIILENPAINLLVAWKQKLAERTQKPKASSQKVMASSGNSVAAVSQTNTATLERKTEIKTTAPRVKNSSQLPSVGKNTSSQSPNHLPAKAPGEGLSNSAACKSRQAVGKKPKTVNKKPKSKETLVKGWLFLFGLTVGVGTVGFVTMKMLLNRPAIFAKPEVQLAIALDSPPVILPVVAPKLTPVKSPVTFTDQARQVVGQWLDSKSAAFGKEHQIEQLNAVLVAPLLTTWRDRAIAYKQENIYREYQHQITIRSAAIDRQNPRQATVEAEVKEVAKHYQAGKLDSTESYDDNLLVRYRLILQGDRWLIENAEVLKTL
jgi:curved DNA-binding protein CbpA